MTPEKPNPTAWDLEVEAAELAASSKLEGHMSTHVSEKWNDGADVDHHGAQVVHPFPKPTHIDPSLSWEWFQHFYQGY